MATEIMGVAAAGEVIGHAGHVAAVVATVAVPRGRPIAQRCLGAANKSESPKGLLRLLSTFAAGNKLKDAGHRHSLFGARAARGTDVFVQSHAGIVSALGVTVNPPEVVTPGGGGRSPGGRSA